MSGLERLFENRIFHIRKHLNAYKKPPYNSQCKDELQFRKKGAGKNGRK